MTEPLVVSETDREPVVDWSQAGRRLRIWGLVLSAVVVSGWLVTGILRSDLSLARAGEWLFVGLVAMFVVELIVVGGSALRGMLRAGERGDRLARPDVKLVPPRIRWGRAGRE